MYAYINQFSLLLNVEWLLLIFCIKITCTESKNVCNQDLNKYRLFLLTYFKVFYNVWLVDIANFTHLDHTSREV